MDTRNMGFNTLKEEYLSLSMKMNEYVEGKIEWHEYEALEDQQQIIINEIQRRYPDRADRLIKGWNKKVGE